jgi:hypothetical protein
MYGNLGRADWGWRVAQSRYTEEAFHDLGTDGCRPLLHSRIRVIQIKQKTEIETEPEIASETGKGKRKGKNVS